MTPLPGSQIKQLPVTLRIKFKSVLHIMACKALYVLAQGYLRNHFFPLSLIQISPATAASLKTLNIPSTTQPWGLQNTLDFVPGTFYSDCCMVCFFTLYKSLIKDTFSYHPIENRILLHQAHSLHRIFFQAFKIKGHNTMPFFLVCLYCVSLTSVDAS